TPIAPEPSSTPRPQATFWCERSATRRRAWPRARTSSRSAWARPRTSPSPRCSSPPTSSPSRRRLRSNCSAFRRRVGGLAMPSPASELREMVGAVTIRSETSFSVGEDTLQLPAADGNGGEPGRASLLTDRLGQPLYRRLYCRPQRGHAAAPASHRAARSFVERLSEANCGRGTWEPGWVVRAVEPDGVLVVHKQTDDLTLWARPEQFRPRLEAA